MNTYYHVSLLDKHGKKESDIMTEYNSEKPLFLDKKGGFFNNIWKDIGINENGYIEYKFQIPKKSFTNSLNPRKKDVILKINNKDILKKFRKLYVKLLEVKRTKEDRANGFNEIFPNLIGFDLTDSPPGTNFHYTDKSTGRKKTWGNYELKLFKKPPGTIITISEKVIK